MDQSYLINLPIFKSLFRGREEIFAQRWEKEGKAIAADFDKANWIEECRSFLTFCHDQGLPVYLERSRSGKGGHVWLFFERPYPAAKSRKIIITLLERNGLFSSFDKNSSFDRLFGKQTL